MQPKYHLIRISELRQLLGGISRSKIERDVAADLLPKPYKLGKRAVAWRSDEVEEYLNSLERIEDAYASRSKETGK